MKLVKYSGENWAALYKDGILVTYGDHYLVTYELERILNVEVRDEDDADDYLLGTNREAASTLEEVEQYTAERRGRESQANELRRQAEELNRKANELMAQADKK